MPVNAVAENVFGTMGQSAFLFIHYNRSFHGRLTDSPVAAGRRDLLDRTAHPTTPQIMAHQVHQRALSLARVSRESIHPTPPPRDSKQEFPRAPRDALR